MSGPVKTIVGTDEAIARQNRDIDHFDSLLSAYRITKAEWELKSEQAHVAHRNGANVDDAEANALSEVHSKAMLALLMEPAVIPVHVREKIRIIHREELFDLYWRGAEVTALLACDAERLLIGGA